PPRIIKNMTAPHLIKSINRSPLRLGFSLTALALACFALPTVARAGCGATGDIPFTVTLLHPFTRDTLAAPLLDVHGPWLRFSDRVNLRGVPVGQPCNSYAAEDT